MYYLVIGGKRIAKNKFLIKNACEAWGMVLINGELLEATVSLTMEEYS